MAVVVQTPVHAIQVNEVLTMEHPTSGTGLQLTTEEQKWLDQHPKIHIAYDGSLPPYSFVNDQGKIDGIALEIMTILSQRLGINFTVYPDSNWTDIYKAAAKRKVDMIATMVKRADRTEWFNFTKPYLTKSLVIVTKLDDKTINGRNDLAEKRIAVVKGYQYAEDIGNEFPTVKHITVNNMLDSLKQVSSGQVDAAILFLGTANYLQSKYQLDNLKVAAFYDRNSANESIAIRKDWPLFVGILQKGLDSLTEKEVQAVFAKWIVGNPISPPIAVPQQPPAAPPLKPVIKEIEQKPMTYNSPKRPIEQPQSNQDLIKLLMLALLIAIGFFCWLMLLRKQKKRRQLAKTETLSTTRELHQTDNDIKPSSTDRLISISTEEVKLELQEQNGLATNEYIYYQHDLDGQFSYVSSSVVRLLGYSESDFMANYRSYLTENPVNRHIDTYTDACIQGQTNKPYMIEIYDANRDKRWLEVTDSPVYNGQGHCIGIDGVMHDITAQQLSEGLAVQTLDPLYTTIVHNDYPALIKKVSDAIQSAQQNHKSFALIFLAIERLRLLDGSMISYIDKDVLNEASKRLHATLRATDIVVQLGDTQFALILPETEVGAISLIVDKIRKILQIPYLVGVRSIVLDANIGSSFYPGRQNEPEALINEAKALSSFNEPQLSTMSFPAQDELRHDDSFQLQQDLVSVLDECGVALRASSPQNINALNRHSQFAVYYQSRHNLEDYSINGFEALIRWNHPKLGLLLPKDFVGLTKEIGMLEVLTYWIIQQVGFQAMVWEAQGIRPKVMAINLDDLAIRQALDVAKIVAVIKETGAQPGWLEFSIPESEIAKNPDKVIPFIKHLVAEGLQVAIDNFGSDRALLMLIKAIPVQTVEIDPVFIRGLPDNTGNAEIISNTIDMLHELNKTVIVKEIENEQQLDFLKKRGCDVFQGYLLSRPLPAKEAKILIESLPDLVWYLEQTF